MLTPLRGESMAPGDPVDLPELRLTHPPPEPPATHASLRELLRRRFGVLGGDEPF